MKLFGMFAAGAFACLLGGAAMACDGQAGATVFEDNFADDSGGWDLTPDVATITPPTMTLTVGGKYTGVATQNLTFSATDGDYCLDFTFPPNLTAQTTLVTGIQFWATDYANTMMVIVTTGGQVAIFKRAGQNWNQIWAVNNSTAIKAGANSLHVVAKAGKIDVSVNGTPIKSVRAQVPTGQLRFGIFAEIDGVTTTPMPITVQGFKVTAGQ